MTSKTVNFNIGVLGHIDSGKTSLGKHPLCVLTLYLLLKLPEPSHYLQILCLPIK